MVQSLIPSDFLQNIMASSTSVAVDFLRSILAALWTSFQPYFPYAVAILFVLLVIASVDAMLGRTGMLGSLLYHIFYFGILGVIVWIEGLEILLNPYFDLIGLALYRFCYWLTGVILQKFRNRY
ncbi:MAG: hypothetical protein UR98_C0012G0003 [Parcubacteria group bacterium GW2011_GWA1_36_12]|uniref:Uncharacterized protein n=1 Tax=Candidatus Daviesbacteria bacterium GW2011_GWB1_41_5 TaxID=1618429 RepID=A0A0G0ZJX1_9BACT|nr:MAG: hypothetical protein UR98_C0012G0003 [Parcubacteria group bacterium GW2011_GWA1_36_12]KKS13248.1 MAG: hypothetical protein UU67_C0028G0003 [Candidatus Daviesbacteria bacterium GW2011_GWB1_41_5]